MLAVVPLCAKQALMGWLELMRSLSRHVGQVQRLHAKKRARPADLRRLWDHRWAIAHSGVTVMVADLPALHGTAVHLRDDSAQAMVIVEGAHGGFMPTAARLLWAMGQFDPATSEALLELRREADLPGVAGMASLAAATLALRRLEIRPAVAAALAVPLTPQDDPDLDGTRWEDARKTDALLCQILARPGGAWEDFQSVTASWAHGKLRQSFGEEADAFPVDHLLAFALSAAAPDRNPGELDARPGRLRARPGPRARGGALPAAPLDARRRLRPGVGQDARGAKRLGRARTCARPEPPRPQRAVPVWKRKEGQAMLRRLSRAAFIALVLAAAGCSSRKNPPPPGPPTLTAGDASIIVDAAGQTLTLKRNGQARLTFAADGFQLGVLPAPLDLRNQSYDPFWLEPARAGPEGGGPDRLAVAEADVDGRDLADRLQLDLTFAFASGPATLRIQAEREGRFPAVLGPEASPIRSATPSPGCGCARGLRHGAVLRPGRVGRLGHPARASSGPCRWRSSALESGYNEAHAPVPLLIGTRGWGLFVASRHPGLFDVARKDPARGRGHLRGGRRAAAFADLPPLRRRAASTSPGSTTRWPASRGCRAPWALGPLMWRNDVTGQAQVLDDADQIRARHLPASGYWLDRPYASGVNTFDFDPAKYADAPSMVRALQADGLRVAVWHAPYLAAAGHSEASPELQSEAEAQGYFPTQAGLLLNSWGPPIDFTNPAATGWWQGLLQRYTKLSDPDGGSFEGVDGFKLDFAEDVQPGLDGLRDTWKFSDGSDERTMQSRYQLLYHQTYAAVLPGEGGLLLCRTGRWGDQVNGCIIWPGNLESDFSNQGDVEANGSVSVGGLPAAFYKGLGWGRRASPSTPRIPTGSATARATPSSARVRAGPAPRRRSSSCAGRR